VSTHIESALRGTPEVSAKAARALAHTVSQGSGAASGLGALPAKARPAAIHAVRASFTTGLNEVFLVGAVLTLVSAVLTLFLIRSRDFESSAARSEPRPDSGQPAERERSADREADGSGNGQPPSADGSAARATPERQPFAEG
jgi:hypothetical protein